MQFIAPSRGKTLAALLADSPVSRLDAEVLLAHVLKRDRAWLFAHSDEAVPLSALSTFQSLLLRRQSGEPLAYITREKEFYGRMFHVDPRVMVPRPSTEVLIDEVKSIVARCTLHVGCSPHITNADTGVVVVSRLFPRERVTRNEQQVTLVDVGTGSGCIAITLALELPEATIIASDVSADALDVVRINAKRHGVFNRITIVQDSFIPVTNKRINEETFLLVSNPPYLRIGRDEHPSTAYEPAEVLYAGADGLNVLLPLIQQAKRHPQCVGFVIECLEEQLSRFGLDNGATGGQEYAGGWGPDGERGGRKPARRADGE